MASRPELDKADRWRVNLLDKLLLGSWVFSYIVFLWCFRILGRFESSQAPSPPPGSVRPSR